MVKRSELEPLIIQEWLKRPENKRSETDVLGFYGYLQQNRPDLLRFKYSGADKYQAVKAILTNFILE